MALTALPISTISYNTRDFLILKLDALLQSGKLDDFRVIYHYGEGGDKDHMHVLIYPSRRIDTVKLGEYLKEIDLQKPGMYLGTMPWRKSAPDHWLMYVLHDPSYLRAHKKNDEAEHKIKYDLTDIYTPYPQQLERDYKSALALQRTDNQVIIDALEAGKSVVEIMYTYDLAPQKVNAVFQAWRSASMVVAEQIRYDAATAAADLDPRLKTLAMISEMEKAKKRNKGEKT